MDAVALDIKTFVQRKTRNRFKTSTTVMIAICAVVLAVLLACISYVKIPSIAFSLMLLIFTCILMAQSRLYNPFVTVILCIMATMFLATLLVSILTD